MKLSSQCSCFIPDWENYISHQACDMVRFCKLLCYYFWNDCGITRSQTLLQMAYQPYQVIYLMCNALSLMTNKAGTLRRQLHIEHFPLYSNNIFGEYRMPPHVYTDQNFRIHNYGPTRNDHWSRMFYATNYKLSIA